MTAKHILHVSYKSLVALSIMAAVLLLMAVGLVKLYGISRQLSQRAAAPVVPPAQTGTIVWPDGSQTSDVVITEIITPEQAQYQEGGVTYTLKTHAFTLNPLARADQAIENDKPFKWEQGPRPSISADSSTGIDTTATKSGGKFTGASGPSLSIWDAIPWIAVVLCFLVLLPIGKALWDWLKKTASTASGGIAGLLTPRAAAPAANPAAVAGHDETPK